MAAPLDPNKSVHVGESMSEDGVLIDVPVLDWKTAMEMNWPLPPVRLPLHLPLPHHSNSNRNSAKSRAGPSLDEAIEYELKHGSNIDPNIDARTLRRTISNRRAARRSRLRRCQYRIDLEKKQKHLEELVKSLNSQIEICKEKNRVDQEENISLRTAVVIRTNEENIAQDNMEKKWREMMRLREKLIRNQNQDTAVGKSTSVAEELNHRQLMNIPAEPDSLTGLINFDDDGVDQYLNLDGMN